MTEKRYSGFVLVFLLCLTSCGTGIRILTNALEVVSWSFVDGNGDNGLNRDTTKSASGPVFTTFNSKLYGTWAEGVTSVVRVVVYGGQDSSPVWSSVDGGAGMNKNPTLSASSPMLVVFNSKLYAVWSESNGAAGQIRAAVYNGNDAAPSWTFVDGGLSTGINKSAAKDAGTPLAIVLGSKLYVVWAETSAAKQMRCALYNSNDSAPVWTFVDGNGTNGLSYAGGPTQTPNIAILNSSLFVSWGENGHIRVLTYNGDDGSPTWTFVDGNGTSGINKDPVQAAQTPYLVTFNSKLYAFWAEKSGANFQVRAAVYGGSVSSSWSFIDGNSTTSGLNVRAPSSGAFGPGAFSYNSKLYVTWTEGPGANYQIHASVYNGDDSAPLWTAVDGSASLNLNTAHSAQSSSFALLNSKLYLGWIEVNSSGTAQVRMALASCGSPCYPQIRW